MGVRVGYSGTARPSAHAGAERPPPGVAPARYPRAPGRMRGTRHTLWTTGAVAAGSSGLRAVTRGDLWRTCNARRWHAAATARARRGAARGARPAPRRPQRPAHPAPSCRPAPAHLHVVHAVRARRRGLQLVDDQARVMRQPPQRGRQLAVLRLAPRACAPRGRPRAAPSLLARQDIFIKVIFVSYTSLEVNYLC